MPLIVAIRKIGSIDEFMRNALEVGGREFSLSNIATSCGSQLSGAGAAELLDDMGAGWFQLQAGIEHPDGQAFLKQRLGTGDSRWSGPDERNAYDLLMFGKAPFLKAFGRVVKRIVNQSA